jgi:DUF971 family protein
MAFSNSLRTQITADRDARILTVAWNDGHTSHYPFGLLRAACPCASCRGGHENMSATPDADVFDKALPESAATRIKQVELVGSYAITFEWEDGHHYGIFNWYYLRALCPCAQCREDGHHVERSS